MSPHNTRACPSTSPLIGSLSDLGTPSSWAEKKWPEPVRAMIQEGAGSCSTVEAHERAWLDWPLHTRVLTDISHIDTSVIVLGRKLSAPVLGSSSWLHTLAHHRGEITTAEGASAFGTTMVLSSGTGTPMEDVLSVGGPAWFQFNRRSDRGALREILTRAVELGCRRPVPDRRLGMKGRSSIRDINRTAITEATR